MVDYPPHRRQLNKDQEDCKDWISNPKDLDIAAYKRWVAKQLQLTPATLLLPALATHQQTMVEEYVNNIIHQSQVHAGYSINANGGSFCNSGARPLENKVRVAKTYARLLKADPTAPVRAVAGEAKVSRGFALKVIDEIEDSCLMDPKQKVRWYDGQPGAGAKTISDEDGEILLAMQRNNNRLTLGSYSIGLYNATGKYVSRSVICKWFLKKHTFKGALCVLNQVLINKYSPDNCLRLMEYVIIITQIDLMCLKFCDKKHLKGRELFSQKGRRDPQTGIVEHSAFRWTSEMHIQSLESAV
jgi:hypothetical protein